MNVFTSYEYESNVDSCYILYHKLEQNSLLNKEFQLSTLCIHNILACYITRLHNSGLELIVRKWAHSLLEVDLAWSTATTPLDAAVFALAEKGEESKLR